MSGANPSEHHMWLPAYRLAEERRAQLGVNPTEFADWFVANRWQDSVAVALADYYLDQRRPSGFTKAAKEKAVAELAIRLAGISENRAYADVGAFGPGKPGDVKYFARRQHLLQGAILRIAMAETID